MKSKILIPLLLLSLFPITVFAQATFRKAYGDNFNFELDAGTAITHNVTIINTKNAPIDLELYATDGTVTETGGYTAESSKITPKHVGKWITFSEKTFHFDGKGEKNITFTITVPVDTPPGSYAGALSLEPATPISKLKTSGAVISTRIALPIYVTIKGIKKTSYEWTDFSHKQDPTHKFLLSMSNSGNTIINVKGNITITDMYGNVETLPIGDMTLLQNKKQSVDVFWQRKPLMGYFTATANLKFYEYNLQMKEEVEIGKESKTTSFSVIPWLMFVLLAFLIILLAAALLIKNLYKKKYLKRCTSYTIASGDTLTNIAKKNKVDWKKLVKINRLRPPYDVSPGQKILLPPKK